jgi:hypothetical protein
MEKLITLYLFSFSILITSCQQKGNNQNDGGEGPEKDTLALKAESLRNNWQDKLKSMNTIELHEQLKKESLNHMEPFNSMALKEIISRGKNSFDELSPQIESNRSSLLSLMALKEIDIIKYKQLSDTLKVAVLIDALKNAKTFNTFGLPHVRWEAAAKAIIELGDANRAGLIELLKDRRAAPVWGSEDYQEYVYYQYRVCDYAYALLTSKGQPSVLPQKQEERDRLIQNTLGQK